MSVTSNISQFTNQLPISFDINPDEPQYQDILLLYIRRIANSVNTKESGLFLLQETANFEQWFTSTPQQTRSGYRITFDLVALNFALHAQITIPNGTTSLVLSPTTQPPMIDGYLYPTSAEGGAIDATGLSYFLNDPDLYVRYMGSTNTLIIQNNTGNALTWAVWSQSYLKS